MFLLRIRGLQKNAGNAAVKAKNYPEAFKQYEAYLKIVNNKDNATVYNTAYCATKIKNYAAAEKYFDMSIKNNYKGASSYLGKAQAQKSQNKTAEMLTTLQDGMKAFPGNMKLETMYAAYYMKEGQTFQKAGDEAKAAENYTKVVNLTTKSFKTQGLASLASLYFNNGAKILQAATPITRYSWLFMKLLKRTMKLLWLSIAKTRQNMMLRKLKR